MIKCNRCGAPNATDAVRCQSCGIPLSGKAETGVPPRGQDQPVPAWLETLRAGERSVGARGSGSDFSTADFAEEGSLPSWMRAERNEAQTVTGLNSPVSMRPSTQGAPQTGGTVPPSNIAARSLVDEQALPKWMQEGKTDMTPPSLEGINASSLVQPDNVPEWMKSLQQSRPASGRTGQAEPAPVDPPQPPPASTGFSARDLIDQQALPSWMTQQGAPGGTSAAPPSTPAAQSGPVQVPNQPGFSARDLIDQQALPAWMTQQGGQSATPGSSISSQSEAARPTASTPANTPGQSGFSARDLVDQQALPPWMAQLGGQQTGAPEAPRQNEPVPSAQPGQGMPASSLLDMNSLPPWLRESGQGQSPSSSAPQSQPVQDAQGGKIAGSSFIDMNALPEWMRGQAGQGQSGQYEQAAGTPPTPMGPPRVENVRVPSRPRGEVSTSETSEVAANVFASMLGVASAAPNYPVPQSGMGTPYPQGAQGQPGYPMGQMNQPGTCNLPASGALPPTSSGVYGTQQPAPTPGYGAPGMAGTSMPGNAYGSYAGGNQASLPGNNPTPGSSQYPPAGMAAGPAAPEQKQGKKRGIFGALLDWLAR